VRPSTIARLASRSPLPAPGTARVAVTRSRAGCRVAAVAVVTVAAVPDRGEPLPGGVELGGDHVLDVGVQQGGSCSSTVPPSWAIRTSAGGNIDLAKTNLYRSEIGWPPVTSQNQASSSPPMLCQNLVNIQTPFIAANESVLASAPSTVSTVGDSLYTFLASRLAPSTSSTAELRPDRAGCRRH
jgi:hypothetical protein